MKPINTRITHYANRMLSTQIDPTIASVGASAVSNYTTFANDYATYQAGLHAILDPAGVGLATFAAYNAFNGRMYHFHKICSGVALTAIAVGLVAQWSLSNRLGAGSVATLKKICLDLYQITVP